MIHYFSVSPFAKVDAYPSRPPGYNEDMPEIIESMPSRRSPLGAAPKYDWPTIFDGRVHRFRLEEIPSTPRNFGRQVRRAAAVHGVEVVIRTRGAQGVYVEAQLN